jgi:hypothetical protein
MVDEALAAKQWANRENISPYSTDTVGVLNEIAGLGLDKRNWLDFNGVCNYIAGTSGLPAAAALRQIYPTTDLLTGVASYYVDATTPRYNYPGYIYLPGITGQYISTPDATALDVTGDLDIRVQVAMDSWSSAVETKTLLSKDNISAGTRSYSLDIAATGSGGGLTLTWTTDGSTGTRNVKSSTVAIPFTAGTTSWVRATLDVNNGASGNTVTFYTSTDGSTWTALGSPVVTAGTTSVYAGTSEIQIGAVANQQLSAGKFYRAQIFASINDTDKRLDVDLTTNVTSATFNQFTATTGQLVTINGQDTLTNGGAAGSLLPTTVGSSLAADSNDPKFLDHTGTNYVYVPGVASNSISVPDAAALDITGDIDIRAYVAADDWTPAARNILVSKSVSSQVSYEFNIETDGTLRFYWSADGTTLIVKTSTAAVSFADGALRWVRVTLDVNNGASGNDVKFFTSTDGTTWTQLGSTVTTAGVTSIFSSTSNVFVGVASNGLSNPLAGKIYRAQIYSDITETTKVLDVDTSVITAGSATSFTAVTGQTVTINRSTSGRKTVAVTQPTWLFGTDDYMEVNNRYMAHSTAAENYVYLNGVVGSSMTVADNPPLDVTGDIDIRVRVALDDWTTPTQNTFVSKESPGDRAYSFYSVGGALSFSWSVDGNTIIVNASTIGYTPAAGTLSWVRVTHDIDNGAGGNTTTFYTSSDGITWTELGAPSTRTGTTSIYSGANQVAIGARANSNSPAKGKFFRAQILNGIDGTIVLDADASVITLPSQTTFVDRSSNAYTVTINKSGVGTFVSTGNYMYLPGVISNFASAPDSAALDITGDIDIRVKVAMDDWTPSTTQSLLTKYLSSGNGSYSFFLNTSGNLGIAWVPSTVLSATSTVATGIADGTVKWVRVTLDVDNGALGNTATFFTSDDGITWTQLGSAVTQIGITSILNSTASLNIGSVINGGAELSRGKFFRAQVLNGINGTVAFDANFENSITSLNQASFTESSTNGATVTINRSGSTFRSAGVIDAGYLYPGATNTFSNSTTDFLNFSATDPMTIVTVIRPWSTQVAGRPYIMKGGAYIFSNDGTNLSTRFIVNGSQINTSSVLTNGNLSTLTGVVNRAAANSNFYVNGNLIAPTVAFSSSMTNIEPLRIARTPDGFYQDFEFIGAAVFRTVLTATQIRQIVNYFANREVYL